MAKAIKLLILGLRLQTAGPSHSHPSARMVERLETNKLFETIFHVRENTKRLIIFVMFINYIKMEHSSQQFKLARKLIEWIDFKVAGTAQRIARLKRKINCTLKDWPRGWLMDTHVQSSTRHLGAGCWGINLWPTRDCCIYHSRHTSRRPSNKAALGGIW